MTMRKTYSQTEIWAIIEQIAQENFILANAVKMVYFAGFHKNEIEKIRIGDAFQNNAVLSEIAPFLRKTKKAYTSMPIILDAWPRKMLGDHIKRLDGEGYAIAGEAPLFPDPRTKHSYNPKTLKRQFNQYFTDISFDDLRKFGYEREQRRLSAKYGHTQQFSESILRYSRHSRGSTTQRFIEGKSQIAGKRKKTELPWETIVRLIEKLPGIEMPEKAGFEKAVREKINTEIKEKDVRQSLDSLLHAHIKR
jgi:hypothetical protein